MGHVAREDGVGRVAVTYRKGSETSTVTVASDAATGTVWVELDPTKLELRPDNKRMRFSKSARIESISVTDSTSRPLCSSNKSKSTLVISVGPTSSAGKKR